ncbi:flavodoxin [Bacteroides faecichinchillae]
MLSDKLPGDPQVAQKEQKENARPAIKGKMANMSDYDVIYLGYSNW